MEAGILKQYEDTSEDRTQKPTTIPGIGNHGAHDLVGEQRLARDEQRDGRRVDLRGGAFLAVLTEAAIDPRTGRRDRIEARMDESDRLDKSDNSYDRGDRNRREYSPAGSTDGEETRSSQRARWQARE